MAVDDFAARQKPYLEMPLRLMREGLVCRAWWRNPTIAGVAGSRRPPSHRPMARCLLTAFLDSAMRGHMEALLTIRDEDIAWYGAGGGMGPGVLLPVRGAVNAARFDPPEGRQSADPEDVDIVGYRVDG